MGLRGAVTARYTESKTGGHMSKHVLFLLIVATILAIPAVGAQDVMQVLPETAGPMQPSHADARKTELKTKMLLQRLASADITTRESVSYDLYGSSENLDEVLQAIAVLVQTELPAMEPKDDRQREVAWHLKTLGASGKAQYKPLIEQGLSSQNRYVAAYAQEAMRALDLTSKTGFPLLLRSKVRVLNALEAQDCLLVRQQPECSSMRGADQCKVELGYQTMEAGGDAFLPVNSSGRGWLMKASVTADIYLCKGNYTKDDGTF